MQKSLIGIALLIVGVGLLYWGYSESQSVSSQVTEAFSGSPQDEVMYKYIAGAVCAGLGIFMLIKSR